MSALVLACRLRSSTTALIAALLAVESCSVSPPAVEFEPYLGQNDLYVSFREGGGGWSTPENLGPAINTDLTDFCPMVTPDGKYLFFSRRTGASWAEATEGEIFWVDIRVIERFRR